ncbi:MAG: PLP-dependent aspartate aminotransferase family protein [Candidatus Korobacteraceae bacterium]|jgi:cystathionine gamma-lyase/cystathionine beta-lyase/cystathionine gamma-lyase/homocysteine desulfhydrase
MTRGSKKGFSTRAIHDGQEPDELTGAIGIPIYPTSTYAQDELGKPRMGYEYGRVSNPTRDRLETSLASLETGIGAKVFASGMAAVHAFCNIMKSGDHVLCTSNVYGGVPRLFDQVMTNIGLEVTYVNTEDLDAVEDAIRGNTRYLYAETPTNPLMALSDIAALAEVVHRHGIEMIVDNTFMSPYFQRPLELGADMVLHSTTKFLNGHSDGLGGAIICSKREQVEKLAFIQKAAGAIMSPFECWLVLRGVKTLPVRMKQHDENGRVVADFLNLHRKVSKVYYPGLPEHPRHELAKRQMSGFGSMIAFETGSLANATRLLKDLRVCILGESLGGVETLIAHPATMSHAAIGEEGRKRMGITDGVLRLSVGLEDVEDIIGDLEQALERL